MKTKIQWFLPILAALLATTTLSAQTLKWTYTNTHNAQILNLAGDGHGALVVIEFGITNDYSGRILWFAPDGRMQLTHHWQQNGENGFMDIVRLTPGELAVRFYPRTAEGEAPKNVLRRFKKRGNKIATVDAELPQNETIPVVSPNLTDRFGFFTFGNGIRRYSN